MNSVLNNSESYSIPISLIRQFLFCPRIVFFNEVLGIKGVAPAWTNQGNKHHKRQILLSKERTFNRFDLKNGKMFFDVFLKSELHQIHGICDALIETDEEIIVIDFKLTEKVHRGHVLQLFGYALSAQEIFSKKAQIGFILSGEKAKSNVIEFTPEVKAEFFRTLELIKSALGNSIIPNSSANELQCGQCEFINFCNDRF